MKLQNCVHEYRSKLFKKGKYGIIKFLENTKLDLRFGIPNDNIFRFWDVVEPLRYRHLRSD